MRLNFTANNFVFGCINRKNAPRTLFTKLARRKLLKCVWTSQQTASFFNTKIVELRPELFLWNLQAENFQNASEFHSKQLRSWTHKSWNCAQNFFFETCRQRTSRMRLNFTANSFVFGRTNHGISPRTFSVKLAGRELPKCVWAQRQTASFLDAWIGKMRPELFYKAWKARASKMRLKFTANRFFFRHINRGIAPGPSL